jgi:hypothetical protein
MSDFQGNSEQPQGTIDELRQSVTRLTKDLLDASRTLSDIEARFLVDAYYAMQEQRIGWAGRVRSLRESGEPIAIGDWLQDQGEILEQQVKRALDRYSAAHPVGVWARSICGVGPVIAAGLFAHIDITRAKTVGDIWAFAGLSTKWTPDGTYKGWQKGTKRPWNASLKSLCAFKLGESFVKVQGRDSDFYGKLFAGRKAEEWKRNLAGELAEQAIDTKAKFAKTTDAYKWRDAQFSGAVLNASPVKGIPAEDGNGLAMLPPAAIHARARRWTVKLFLSHLHQVWYFYEHGVAPPAPYVFAVLGHKDWIDPPGWVPFTKAGEENAP